MLGDVVIRKDGKEMFRIISDREKFFEQPIMQCFQNEHWRKVWLNDDKELFLGPYCLIPSEEQIPF